MRHLGTSVVLFLLLASQLFWLRPAREWVKRLLASEARRVAVVVGAGAFYLILFALHLLWPLSMEFFLVSSVIVVVLFASQFFWLRQIGALAGRFISNPLWRVRLGIAGVGAYFAIFFLSLIGGRFGAEPTRLTLRAALLEAPFPWWFVSSLLGFLLASLVFLGGWLVGAGVWAYRRLAASPANAAGDPPDDPAGPASPGRRYFLERTAAVVGAAPFVAGAYGLLYGRLNLEITHQRIPLHRLPKAFDGFRIAQLSDIHIGPFMTAEEIRKWAAIANNLKPDLFALTGDFVTWDRNTQEAVVEALSGLRAPFGIYGCLGNHEAWTDTEASITRLFALRGIRILRHERALIQAHGETLNLLGVDFQSHGRMGPRNEHIVREYLEGLEGLLLPSTANILMSHNPNTFDRAAEMGIDLSLAGHTHGGQVTLEYISPYLSPSRLITDYVEGWFQKPGGQQLYVNRGLGTIGVPIRLGAPPEITLYELVRA